MKRSLHGGFTLIELLMALAISTVLLVAVAIAFHASANTIAANDSYSRCTQNARLAMGQITTELRRADAVKVAADGRSAQVIRPADQLTPGEIYREFRYEPAEQRITLQIFQAGNTAGPSYELAAHVSACTFGPPQTEADGAGVLTVLRVPISLTCQDGSSHATLSAAAGPRRAQRF